MSTVDPTRRRRPSPVLFANLSYYLALVSVGILLLYSVLGLTGLRVQALTPFIWVVLITSAVGAFLAFAARSALPHTDATNRVMRRARTGWRVNLSAFVLMLLFALLFVMTALVPGMSF